jgi:PKD domain
MAEEKSKGLAGWVKAGVTGLISLASGAALMYVSPLVNNAIKPGKPVANFAQQGDGLTVTFNNLSTGATDGWWDFGDGSPLEPFLPSQPTIMHAYPQAGIYTVKLSLRNYVGDENDRAVSVHADASTAPVPVINAFQVVPLSPTNAAPALFRLVGEVKNADLAIWSIGDDRPLEVDADPAGSIDHLVTIKDAGQFTLRLVAVNGKHTTEKSQQVQVARADPSLPGALLQVTYDAVHVRKKETVHNVAVSFPANSKENVYKFAVERQAEPGFQIVKADFLKPGQDASTHDLKLELSADKTKVRLSGAMPRPKDSRGGSSAWTTQIVLTQEMSSAEVQRKMEPMLVSLKVPGTTTIPVPALPHSWQVRTKSISLELRDGGRIAWQGSHLPANQIVELHGHPCRLTATESTGQIRLEVVVVKNAVSVSGDQR